MARPSKLTPEMQDRILRAVRAGNYADAAARECGIAPSTYYRWLARGAAEKHGVHRDFADAIRQSEAEAEVHAVAILRRAMNEDWRAAMAYLERRHPSRWRRHWDRPDWHTDSLADAKQLCDELDRRPGFSPEEMIEDWIPPEI